MKRNCKKIEDISEILNFRFMKKHLNPAWWKGKFPPNFTTDVDLLKSHPKVYDHFKYVLHTKIKINNHSKNNDVFCDPSNLPLLVKFTNEYSGNFGNLVMMGVDRHLSESINVLKPIRDRFSKIYYEAKDIECDWIQTLPMGMIMGYMIRNGGNDISQHINKQKNKKKLIASAFGSKYPQLTDIIKDRKKLENFTNENDFVDNMFCDPLEYYERLCEYKFFIAPLGMGIQTPKICECIMCETVPIVTDHIAHRELRDIYDLPLLILNRWDDLTEVLLNQKWNDIYKNINWQEQKSKFLVKNFNKLLI